MGLVSRKRHASRLHSEAPQAYSAKQEQQRLTRLEQAVAVLEHKCTEHIAELERELTRMTVERDIARNALDVAAGSLTEAHVSNYFLSQANNDKKYGAFLP